MDNAIIQALRRAKQAYMTNVGEPTAQLVGGGVRGYLGLDAPEYADSRGMEAYRNAQALGNAPGVGAPAGAFKAMAAAPLIAKVLRRAPRDEALETARRNAVEMLGLPESNTAMDRARAMGFEDSWYHGTLNDVPAFDINKVKERFPYSIGIHATNRPSEANYYAKKSATDKDFAEGGNVMPLMVRKGNSLDIDTKHVAASMEADLNRAEIIKKMVQAKKSGAPYDSVVINRSRGDEWDGANFITREPANIRSRFAAFDPARVNEADLLGRADPRLLAALAAGTGGAAATVAALRDKKEDDKKKKKAE